MRGLWFLLGIGESNFYKCAHGQPDLRLGCSGKQVKPAPQREVVDAFFTDLYQSAAEPLAHDFSYTCESHDGHSMVQEAPDECILAHLRDWCTPTSPVEQIIHAADPHPGLARRYLPHGTVSDLYWQYLAWHEALHSGSEEPPDPVSFSTFYRAFKVKWSLVLKPRHQSEHSQCQTCFELQAEIYNKHSSPSVKLSHARAWRQHLQNQYTDRLIYWALRWHSRRSGTEILTIIVDGMDKKKTAWPQWEFDRKPKEIESLGPRPRVSVVGALAHGFCADFFLAPDNLPHAPTGYCEVLCQTIQHVAGVCSARGQPLPRHLVLQSDNTVAQTKNSIAGAFCAHLVPRFQFATVTMNFLMVGHTHEDIDQVFGLLAVKVVRRYRFEIAEDLASYMRAFLSPLFMVRGEEVRVTVQHTVRNFKTWLAAQSVVQYGCWGTRDGIEAPHSFAYKLRRDLSAAEKQLVACAPQRPLCHTSPYDVFACIKTYMRDSHLQQPPVCVLPYDRGQRVEPSSPQTGYSVAMTENRKEQLLAMAAVVDRPLYGYHRAAAEMRSLCQQVDRSLVPGPPLELPVTPWLDVQGREPDPVEDSGNVHFCHLPNVSWHMAARMQRL